MKMNKTKTIMTMKMNKTKTIMTMKKKNEKEEEEAEEEAEEEEEEQEEEEEEGEGEGEEGEEEEEGEEGEEGEDGEEGADGDENNDEEELSFLWHYTHDCLQDIVKQQGAPEREPAVFAVRWVQANEKKEPARSRRELRRQEATWAEIWHPNGGSKT